MRTLEPADADRVGGGQPSLSSVVMALGLGITVATAPAWGAAAALVGLTALAVRTFE